MPVITVYPSGVKMGTRSPNGNRIPPKREECKGWSVAATRRNREWLMSIDGDKLTGTALAITLTVGDIPDSEAEWARLRRALFERLRRRGLIRLHWVTEWQRRRAPHMHLAAYFDSPDTDEARAKLAHEIRSGWVELTSHLGTQYGPQVVVPITNAVGWFAYVSKHAARGVKHYQRSPELIPPGWLKTGRMWGYLGDWPRNETRLQLEDSGHHAMRRLIRGYAVADARARLAALKARTPGLLKVPAENRHGVQTGWSWVDLEHPQRSRQVDRLIRAAHREIRYSRRLLRVTDRRRAPVVGCMQWIPRRVLGRFLMHLHESGHLIEADPKETPDA